MVKTNHSLWQESPRKLIIANLEIASSFWTRSVGLLGRGELLPDRGLYIEGCNSIHTFGMKFAIDVVFLDSDGVVLKVDTRVNPWRVRGPVRGAKSVVETAAGGARELRPGMRVIIRQHNSAG